MLRAVAGGAVTSGGTGVAGVSSFNLRAGAVTLFGSDISNAGGALLLNPVFTGDPQAPTPLAGDSDNSIATTSFVQSAITAATSTITVGAVVADTPPGSPAQGALWWNSAEGQLYLSYHDVNSIQWVEANSSSGTGGTAGTGGGAVVATPVRSSAMEAGHVLKASAGTLYYADALNGTSTQCLLVIVDAASVPADGTVTNVIDAIPLPPNGRATFNPSGAAAACSAGVVAYVSTNTASPFTKATSGVSAYFTGMVT